MVFDLVDGGRNRGFRESRFEVVLEVIRYADRFGFAGFLDGFHFRPGVLEVGRGFGEEGGVDEVACVEMSVRGVGVIDGTWEPYRST